MKRIFFVFFVIFLVFFTNTCKADNINIINRKKFDIIATINDIVITKYDLDNLIKIYYHSAKNTKITNELYNDILNNYIDIIKKKVIAKNENTSLTETEKKSLWNIFSENLNVEDNVSIDKFCKDKNIDSEVLVSFLESNYLWLKYVETNIKPKIKINDDYINGVLESINLNNKITKYNLSEIVLYFNNKEAKKEIINKINEIYKEINDKNFETIAFAMSKSMSAKNNGLIGWFYENELNKELINNIKNINKKSISKPFCLGDEKGECFIFKVNDKETIIEEDLKIKNNLKVNLFNEMLKINIKNTLNKNKINIIYK